VWAPRMMDVTPGRLRSQASDTAVGEPEGGRGCGGGGGERLGRSEAGLHQQFEFAVQGRAVADYAERCGG
jgi:hypothetical protein